MNIADWLWRTARATPGAPALLEGDQLKADYRDFARRAAAIAGALRGQYNVTPGARVGVFMENRTQYLEALYGIFWAGAVAVPINAKLHGKEALWILDNAQVDLLFVSTLSAAALRAGGGDQLPPNLTLCSVDAPGFAAMCGYDPMPCPQPREDDDLIWLFYTSGTTGKPKGVMLTNGNIIAMSLCYPLDVDEVGARDAALYAAPLSHGAGMYNFIHVRQGARHVIPASKRFDANEILDLAPRLGVPGQADCVSMFAAPTMVRRLVEAAKQRGLKGAGISDARITGAGISSAGIKTIVYGGAPMYVTDIIEAVDVMGDKFVQIYGLGESPMTITSLSRMAVADRTHPRWRERLGSAGCAQSCMNVAVVDRQGKAVKPGVSGEVVTKGAAVMAGYWRNDEASAKTLRGGWLHTGDIGALDEDGFLTLSDRANDVVISGGSNIYPREVEEVLLSHQDVAQVAVIGRPHAEWGEEVVAFVVLNDNAALDEAALDQLCRDNIARFKRPKEYFVIDELPKNNYGKILKRVLREQLRAGAELA